MSADGSTHGLFSENKDAWNKLRLQRVWKGTGRFRFGIEVKGDMTASGGSGSMVDRENMVIQGHGQPGHLVHKVRDVKAGVDFSIKGQGGIGRT